MTFANPWGLIALLSLPAIVAIHLYRRRFPPMTVAGLHLWGAESEIRAAGRKRERLPITATLLLELLAALVLSLVLAQPKFDGVGGVEHLVVVLDNSASMQAQHKGEPSFREAAANLLKERFRRLGRDGRVTVIVTGRQPATIAGPAVPPQEAEQAIAEWVPGETSHSFEPAWDEAAEFASQTGGQLLFVTDKLPAEDASIPQEFEVVALGRPLQNLAISAAQWTFDSTAGTGSLYLRIDNMGTQDLQATVRGQSGERDLFSQSLVVPAGNSLPLETKLEGGLGTLTVNVDAAGDGLAIDNEVTLVEPKARIVTVANTLPEGHAAREAVERVLAKIPDVQRGSADAAHLVIAQAATLPASQEGLYWLGLGPIDESESAKEKSQTPSARFPYLIEKRNPLLEGVLLDGVVWSGVQPLPFEVIPLVSAGEHRLLGKLAGTQTQAYVLNIDLARSNLTESPDWPILLKNLVDLCRDSLPGLRRWNFPIGETVRFRVPHSSKATTGSAENSTVQLVQGDKSREIAADPDGTVEAAPRDGAGIYDIRDKENSLGQFAVNFFDREESTLSNRAPGARSATIQNESMKLNLDDPYSWIIMLAGALVIGVVFADWKVLQKDR